ncbi:MAG: DUF4013 domain-containing protein [Candidatus Nanoarchaeia archaeon]|nr:DUF4013 domain-containing protein [Candidatus Nanoarchaeia archaeon]
MDFETNFKKPFTDVKKLLIGILLSIFPVINFFSMGYMLETAKRAMKKEQALPEWDNWGDLFVKGLLSIVIEALYFMPALILGAVFLWPAMKTSIPSLIAGQIPDIAGVLTTTALSGMAAGGILALIALYITPSAIMHFIRGKFGDAFSLGSVFRKAFKSQYAMAWLLFILYSMLLGALLNFIPYVGSAAASFIAGITGLSLIAEAFAGIEMPEKKTAEAKPKKAVKKRK